MDKTSNQPIKASKSLSQNFLHDAPTIYRIVSSCSISNTDNLIEIGPGLGALSTSLAAGCRQLTLIEIDSRCIPILQDLFQQQAQVEIKHINAMHYDFINHPHQPYKLIGNLPYHLSTALIQQFIQAHGVIDTMYIMLQKEVAERLCRTTNRGKTKGWLSIFVQALYTPEILFDIEPECFNPIPKVRSSFIKLSKYQQHVDLYNDAIINRWKNFLQTAFRFKRKNLRNNFNNTFSDPDWQSLGINPSLRPEQLQLNDFIHLFDHWQQRSHSA